MLPLLFPPPRATAPPPAAPTRSVAEPAHDLSTCARPVRIGGDEESVTIALVEGEARRVERTGRKMGSPWADVGWAEASRGEMKERTWTMTSLCTGEGECLRGRGLGCQSGRGELDVASSLPDEEGEKGERLKLDKLVLNAQDPGTKDILSALREPGALARNVLKQRAERHVLLRRRQLEEELERRLVLWPSSEQGRGRRGSAGAPSSNAVFRHAWPSQILSSAWL